MHEGRTNEGPVRWEAAVVGMCVVVILDRKQTAVSLRNEFRVEISIVRWEKVRRSLGHQRPGAID